MIIIAPITAASTGVEFTVKQDNPIITVDQDLLAGAETVGVDVKTPSGFVREITFDVANGAVNAAGTTLGNGAVHIKPGRYRGVKDATAAPVGMSLESFPIGDSKL